MYIYNSLVRKHNQIGWESVDYSPFWQLQAERQIMPCTKWGPKNSVYQHGFLTMIPIENLFNYVRTKLLKESLNRSITLENFEEYSACFKKLDYQQRERDRERGRERVEIRIIQVSRHFWWVIMDSKMPPTMVGRRRKFYIFDALVLLFQHFRYIPYLSL